MRFLFQPVLSRAILAVVAAAPSFVAPALSAASTQAPIIRSWGTEAGLPQNSVNAIVQTRDGYLWLGTQDGLARFDGVRFKSFDFKDGLPGVSINALLEDHEGTLWIGTAGSGLCCLKHGRIQSILGSDNQPGSDSIACLAEDAQGQILAGTSGGLRICRDGKLESDSAFGNLRRSPILNLLRSRDGSTMWIASSTYGLFSWQDRKLEPCVGPPGHEKVVGECLFEDRARNLWVGIGNGTVLRLDKNQWRVFGETNGLPFPFITSMTDDADGTVWAGSLDAGLYWFDGQNFNLVSQKDGLSADDIRSLACDREGNLWIGTRTGGLDRLSRRRLSVVSNAQGLTNDFTHSVAQTPDGTLWVGTTGGAMYSGDPAGFKPFRQANDDRVYFYATVFPVLAAPDGSLWWGAHNGLLHWQNDHLADCVTNGSWIEDTTVTALQNDRQGGMWIGTTAGHLLHLQDRLFNEFPEHITRATISSLAVQTNGDLWVGTTASGLKLIPAGSDHAHSFTNGLPPKASVYTLYLDPDGTLWIGTEGGGLSCLRYGRVFTFSANQGLPPPTVMQIVEDDHHFLWLGCRRGIFRVSKADLLACADGKIPSVRSRTFGINDGMLTEECSGGYCPAGLKTKSGLVCISTVKGLVFIDPNEVNDEIPPPTVLLEEALVSGKEQRFETEDGSEINPLSAVPSRPRLVIVPGPRDLELHYSAIGFSAPEKIGFRYRLDPLDTDWKVAGAQRIFSYPHLPPGDFTLHIQACNANGIWNGQDTTLGVTALPFFWETSWFHAIAGVILFGLVAAVVAVVLRRRYKLRLARLQALNAIERERLRISKDMHDQVGSVLTQVSQLTDMGLNETGDQELVKKRFDRIGNRARLAVQSLDEIVWATNPKNDNLASFAEYVSRFSDEFFEYTNVRCWQEMPHTIPAMPLRAEIRHNVFLAVREALNNALKHSKCAEIWLKMTIHNGEATLKIEDNGAGFTPVNTSAGGNGLGNMEARLTECGGRAELNTMPGKGTSITFIFPVK
jgi:ligand-binding sensor domain-containing protein/signal transduction histidine kinase